MVLKSKVFESVVLILLLFLSVVLYSIIVSETGMRLDNDAWNLSASGPVSSITVSDDGTLLVFSGDTSDIGEYTDSISAISPDGSVRWRFPIPDNWGTADRFRVDDQDRIIYLPYSSGNEKDQLFAVDHGQLYLYMGEIISADAEFSLHDGLCPTFDKHKFQKEVVAISPKGAIIWKTQLSGVTQDIFPLMGIYAKNGMIYVYDRGCVTVIASDGKVIYSVTNITRDLTVDDENNLYVVECADEIYNPGSVIASYTSNGSPRWKKDLGEFVFSYHLFDLSLNDPIEFNTLLLYYNHSIHVPTVNNIYTLDDYGNILRVKDYKGLNYALFEPMPIDSRGNLYLLLNSYPPFLDIVSPSGNDRLLPKRESNVTFADKTDGIVYNVVYSTNNLTPENMSMKNLMSASVIAYDPILDKNLWNFTIPLDSNEVYSDAYQGINLIPEVPVYSSERSDNSRIPGKSITYYHYQDQSIDWWMMSVPDNIDSFWGIRIVNGNGTIYVNYFSINQQYYYTLRYNVHSDNIYALDRNGTLLWKKPVHSPVTSMAVNNSTLYYGTQDGRLFAENTGLIAGGFAIIAILYLFIRFFLVGTVARAKDRLNKNENRNCIVQYVTEYPGSTLGDISRGLKMNIGTVRYHILILDMNHRISALQADDKHIRYFQASGQYTMEDRLVMSLARREGMKKVLGALLDKPGLSNMDLSRELNLKESAVSRYMKVLTARGVVDRRPVSGGYLSYSISASHIESVCRVIRQEKL